MKIDAFAIFQLALSIGLSKTVTRVEKHVIREIDPNYALLQGFLSQSKEPA